MHRIFSRGNESAMKPSCGWMMMGDNTADRGSSRGLSGSSVLEFGGQLGSLDTWCFKGKHSVGSIISYNQKCLNPKLNGTER